MMPTSPGSGSLKRSRRIRRTGSRSGRSRDGGTQQLRRQKDHLEDDAKKIQTAPVNERAAASGGPDELLAEVRGWPRWRWMGKRWVPWWRGRSCAWQRSPPRGGSAPAVHGEPALWAMQLRDELIEEWNASRSSGERS
jgi:hypothetical protein